MRIAIRSGRLPWHGGRAIFSGDVWPACVFRKPSNAGEGLASDLATSLFPIRIAQFALEYLAGILARPIAQVVAHVLRLEPGAWPQLDRRRQRFPVFLVRYAEHGAVPDSGHAMQHR